MRKLKPPRAGGRMSAYISDGVIMICLDLIDEEIDILKSQPELAKDDELLHLMAAKRELERGLTGEDL